MKKYLLTGALITITATTLYAQTVAGTSLVDKMKAAAQNFTLSALLNPGETGLQSAPVAGKKTGDVLTAAEWNRMLELVSEGGGGGAVMGKPNLDTGWLNFYPTADSKFVNSTFVVSSKKILFSSFTHTLGGDKNNYLVDVQYEQSEAAGGISELGFNNAGTLDTAWTNLTDTSININDIHNPAPGTIKVRIRIWDTSLAPAGVGSGGGGSSSPAATNTGPGSACGADGYGMVMYQSAEYNPRKKQCCYIGNGGAVSGGYHDGLVRHLSCTDL